LNAEEIEIGKNNNEYREATHKNEQWVNLFAIFIISNKGVL
jgi:hypothetical protein